MRALSLGARGTVGLALLVLVVFGVRDGADVDGPVVVTSSTLVQDLALALVRRPDADVAYVDSLPPMRAVSTLMAGAASRGSRVTVVMPGSVPALQVTPPRAPVALRRSSLIVTVRGSPGARVPVVVDDAAGSADSVSLLIGGSGRSTVSLSVEPTRPGVSTWTVRAAAEQVVVHAWTRPARPVRVLVLSGPPSWESRYLIRALEAVGAVVSVRQDLGRALSVATSGVELPRSLGELDAFDVVALFGHVEGVSEDLLKRWVDEEGGGLMWMGPAAARPPLGSWSPAGPPSSLSAASLLWSGPAELVPLPAAELTLDAYALGPPVAGIPVAYSGSGPDGPAEVYSAAGWLGRGRIFSTGLETWPWVMERGLVAEHAEHWESVVEWLAGGLAEDSYLVGGVGQAGSAWIGRLEGLVPTGFELARAPGPGPVAPGELEQLRPVHTRGGGAYVRFVPTTSGDHALERSWGRGVAVVEADDRVSWVFAAIEIGAAGGEVGPRAVVAPAAAGAPGPDGSPWRRWFGFLLLGSLAVTGWAARRIAGRP